ncbi:hypothetical protein SAMN05880580_10376 [Priestia flexa]|nr:hypothetical protein SAMN05880580_10376 [Priestia flexa]
MNLAKGIASYVLERYNHNAHLLQHFKEGENEHEEKSRLALSNRT